MSGITVRTTTRSNRSVRSVNLVTELTLSSCAVVADGNCGALTWLIVVDADEVMMKRRSRCLDN